MPRDRDDATLRPDANEIGYRTIRRVPGEAEKPEPPGTATNNPAAVKRGRNGGEPDGPRLEDRGHAGDEGPGKAAGKLIALSGGGDTRSRLRHYPILH